jgi:hypothetical protein
MKIATAQLRSMSPYSQSKHYSKDEVPPLPKELAGDYEKRTWRNRMHVTHSGHVQIPRTAFANALKEAAKRLKIQVPGKGKLEYTKYFEAGVMVSDDLTLPIKRDDVRSDELFVPADGRAGSGKRVIKFFPRIDEWSGAVRFYLLDDLIPTDVFERVLQSAGQLVGIGRFRPQSRGFYGRFIIDGIRWAEDGEIDAVLAGAAG